MGKLAKIEILVEVVPGFFAKAKRRIRGYVYRSRKVKKKNRMASARFEKSHPDRAAQRKAQ